MDKKDGEKYESLLNTYKAYKNNYAKNIEFDPSDKNLSKKISEYNMTVLKSDSLFKASSRLTLFSSLI